MTAMFGLSLGELQRAVTPVSAHDVSESNLVAIFARGVWSRLAEPGDSLAGWCVSHFGAEQALRVLIEGLSANEALARQERQERQDGARPSTVQLEEGFGRWRSRLNLAGTLSNFSAAEKTGVRLLTPETTHWPQMLTDLGTHAPLALWTKGDPALLSRRSVAVVGSRAATGYGELVTAEIARGLVSAHIVITSGGAYGIDAIAHRAALANQGATIAVFAGGIDRLYPSGHERLFAAILERGLLCAELPPGSSPTKWRFLQRNRIIAALAEATVISEAGHRSGSLNTAGHAAQLSRPLGAVPGPVTSSTSAGCHRLLREYDAVCIRNSGDVLELLNPGSVQSTGPHESADQERSPRLSPNEIRVLDSLSQRTPRTLEMLARVSGLSTFETADVLAELNMQGSVLQSTLGWVKQST